MNLRDGKKSSSARAERTHEVAGDGESTNAGATEGSGGRDDALELLVHALLAVTGHDQTLVLELLGDVARARAGHLNPSFGEDSARSQHIGDVDGGVDG